MRKQLLICALATVLATPAVAAPWVRSYVVSAYEPAFYFGGKLSYQKEGMLNPGTDCPTGNTQVPDYAKWLKTSWRTQKDIDAVLHPVGITDPSIIRPLEGRGITFRGFRPDIHVYYNPFGAPDPGQPEVVGKIAEGFDLDGKSNTGGFTAPDGRRGVDNALYRAWGCINSYRNLPYHAGMSIRATEQMLEGLFSIVIRLSGNEDPMNDDNVTMEVGYSPDHPVKGGDDRVSGEFSFRIVKTTQYTKLKAKVHDGVVQSEQVDELHMPKFGWFVQNIGDADFHKGMIRLIVEKNGDAHGLFGGYRDWRVVYTENAFPQAGATQDGREHQNLVGMYYALKRNADAMPDPKTGQNMGISTAYRFLAKPAYVVDPAVPVTVFIPTSALPEIQRMKVSHDTFVRAITTKEIQPEPKWHVLGIPVSHGDFDAGPDSKLYHAPSPPAPATADKPDMALNRPPS